MRPAILLVDDDIDAADVIARGLRDDFDVVTASGRAQGIARMSGGRPFLAVVSDAVSVLDEARAKCPSSARILVTGARGLDGAAAAVRSVAAHRFVFKPCPPTHLVDAIEDALVDVEPAAAPGHSTLRPRAKPAARVDLRWIVDDVMRWIQDSEVRDVCLLADIRMDPAFVDGEAGAIRHALAGVVRAAALEARARTREMHRTSTWVWEPPVVSVQVDGGCCRITATVPELGPAEVEAILGAGGRIDTRGGVLVVAFR